MKIYKSTKSNPISNRVVNELNAAVCTATFASTEGLQAGDLYKCVNSSNVIVSAGTCAPIHGEFVETLYITFD